MSSNKFLYFAYGSNLWSKRIRDTNKSATFFCGAILKNYRLEFGHPSKRWGGAAANIVKDESKETHGVVWELSEQDHSTLDEQEGVDQGIYERIQISVTSLTSNEVIPCISYTLTEKTVKAAQVAAQGGKLVPSLAYKKVMVAGAKENNLPQSYINYLKKMPDNGFNGNVNFKYREPVDTIKKTSN